MKRYKKTADVKMFGGCFRVVLAVLIVIGMFATNGFTKTRVVCSTNDLGYLARQIGGSVVKVTVIAQPKRDIHFVDVRPSFMMKVAKADIVFRVGLDLDLWMDKIVDGSRNSNLIVMDCSRDVQPLEVPTYKADARYGDIHQRGNPHYWLTPDNLGPITDVIVEGLSRVDPEHAEEFDENRKAMMATISDGIEKLRPKLDSLRGVEVIFYHNSWPYFAQFTGLVTAGFIEPFPGVPPSPSQLKKIADLVAKKHIKVICSEVYFDKRPAQKVSSASKSGATVVTMYPSIGGRNKEESYLEWFEGNVNSVLEGLR